MRQVTYIFAALLVFLSVSVAQAGVTMIVDLKSGFGFGYPNPTDHDLLCVINAGHTQVRCTNHQGEEVIPYDVFAKQFGESYGASVQPLWTIQPNPDAGKPIPPPGKEAPKLQF